MRAQRVSTPHQAVSGWLLALCSTALTIAAHGWAGGEVPDTALIIPLTALIAWGATALAGRLRGAVPLTAALAVVQVGLHLLLDQGAHAGHPAAEPAAGGWAMFAVHALATLITAALLSGASSGLTLVSSALAWLLARLVAVPLTPVAAPPAIGAASPLAARPGLLLEVLLRRVSARRGPPVRS